MESPTHLSYRSKKHNLYLLVAIILLNASQVAGFTFPEEQQQLTVRVVDYVINNQYDSALLEVYNCSMHDSDPLPPLLKLAVLGMRDVDFEKIIDSTLFLACYDTASAMLTAWEQKKGTSSYTRMLSGMCNAIHAAFYLRQKRYVNAMQNGFDALDKLREAQQMDSTNYEVDFFLGLYEYARAELRARLWWVLFWYPGDREKGIERVRRCSNRALLTGEAAKLSLCDIYIQENRKEDARQVVSDLKQKYPSSRFVLWAEVKYLETVENYSAAATSYSKLAMLYTNEKHGEFNALTTTIKQAQMLYKAGKASDSKVICDKLLRTVKLNNYRDLKKEVRQLRERCDAVKN